MPESESAKLQKVLANAGLASRRAAEEWIKNGRLKIDGKVAKLGDRVTNQNYLSLDGKLLTNLFKHQPTRVLLYHKSEGEICTRSDPQGRVTVFANLPKLKQGRWVMVGRLDINSSGLLLFTNDGELANRLLHPSFEVEREYLVRVLGEIDDKKLHNMRTGVRLEDGKAKFLSIQKVRRQPQDGANKWYKVVIGEGRNRLVRRIFDSQGLKVNRLKRIRFGKLVLPRALKPKTFVEIEQSAVL